jgi:imidazolonepropionase
MQKSILFGPFKQLITMNNLPVKGPIADDRLEVLEGFGILVQNGIILDIAPFDALKQVSQKEGAEIHFLDGDYVVMPGMIDAHTHICYAGSRATDYAMRLSGKSYIEIAEKGGGIWSTVTNTRATSEDDLYHLTRERALRMLRDGVTTAEVKSGYALNKEGELKILQVIRRVNENTDMDLVSTCLAAHMVPRDFSGTSVEYLDDILEKLLPEIKRQQLSNRIDVFIEKSAFACEESLNYLRKAKDMGFDIVVHADQFTTGGSEIACRIQAVSADHLEASTDKEIDMLAKSNVIAVCLPGASIGLGMAFAPARKLLNAGASLAIASDWNPGSAPMGDLLMQASVLGTYEHLTLAETLAAITVRAASALRINDRGILKTGHIADFSIFATSDYRDIFYHQGRLKPEMVVKRGSRVGDRQ